MDRLPTPIPTLRQQGSIPNGSGHSHTSNESSRENGVVAGRGHGSALNGAPDNADAHIDQDGIFPRDDLGKKTRVQSTEPSAELKNGGEPALLRLILNIVAHVYDSVSEIGDRSRSMHLRSEKEVMVSTPLKTPWL